MGDFRLFCIALSAVTGVLACIEITTGLHDDWSAPERLISRFTVSATVAAVVVTFRALTKNRPA